MKKTVLLMFLLLIPFVLAEEKSFTTIVTVKTVNNTAHIETEGYNASYLCNVTSTNTFTSTITRNVETFSNVSCTAEIYSLSQTCDKGLTNLSSYMKDISEAYSDAKSYYNPYLNCVSNLSATNTQLALFRKDSGKLNLTETKLEVCREERGEAIIEKGTFQSNYQCCQTNYATKNVEAEKFKNHRVIFGFLGLAIGAGVVWFFKVKRKEKASPVEKEGGIDVEEETYG